MSSSDSKNSFQESFDKATQYLSEKKYKETTEALNLIQEKGYTSASIEDSLGRSYFEMGEPGRGIEHFLNAVSLDRFNSQYRQNLFVAQQKTEGGMSGALQHPAEWAHKIASYVRPLEFFSIASMLLLACIGVSLSSNQGQRKKLLRGLAALVVLMTSLGVFTLSGRNIAVVVVAEAPVRSAPLESAEALTEVKSGARVRVVRKSGDYIEIERPNSFKGWVLATNVARSPF